MVHSVLRLSCPVYNSLIGQKTCIVHLSDILELYVRCIFHYELLLDEAEVLITDKSDMSWENIQ